MIFISYRRSDSQAAAGRLHDRLAQHFSDGEVFLDVEAIEPGVDFVASLSEQLSTCEALIAVIGPDWLATQGRHGSRKLDDPEDYVRLELEAAIARDIRVIPVLVDGATMPTPDELPPGLQPLARRNAVILAHHRFTDDCDQLAAFIKRTLGRPTEVGLTAREADRPLSWPEVLFSFRGRITRQQFVLGALTLFAFAIAFIGTMSVLVELTFGSLEAQARESVKGVASVIEDRTATIVSIALWWPAWALILKRLRDLGHGWRVFAVFVMLDIATIGLEIAGKKELSGNLMLLTIGMAFMLAVLQGQQARASVERNSAGDRRAATPAQAELQSAFK